MSLSLKTGVFSIKCWIEYFVVHSLSRVSLFVTPRTAAQQTSLSFTISQSLLKFMSIESVMLSNHAILCHPLLLLSSILTQSILILIVNIFMWIFCKTVTSMKQKMDIFPTLSTFSCGSNRSSSWFFFKGNEHHSFIYRVAETTVLTH